MNDIGWLTTWKNIAAYIKVSTKTAKKYHKQYSMPVRRLPGGTVQALPYELDRWLQLFNEKKKNKKTWNLP